MLKKEAIKRMKKMNILPTVIEEFEKSNDIAIFENQGWPFLATYYSLNMNINMEEYKALKEKIEWLESKCNVMVYMVQLSHTSFGELYSIFFVSNNEEEWEYDNDDIKNNLAYTYVWNKTNEEFSEFGTIAIKKAMGGIYRTN